MRVAPSSSAMLEIARAAYRPAGSTREWMERLVESAWGFFTSPALVAAVQFDTDLDGNVTVQEMIGPSWAWDGFRRSVAAADLTSRLAVMQAGPVMTMKDYAHLGSFDEVSAVHADYGMRDCLTLCLGDPAGPACNLAVGVDKELRLGTGDRKRLARCAAHLAAARRLWSRQHAEEAVLAPDGKLLHAEGEAKRPTHRDGLRQAALALEAQRRRKATPPDEVLSTWRALVEGRWSMVQRFDSDGRRFWIAIENEPHVQEVRKLTPREQRVVAFACMGHSQKLIAYELGVTESAVSTAARSARRKLGLRSRAELVELASALAAAVQRNPAA